MIEEIAESMTSGGIAAAVVGVCAVLVIAFLRRSEKQSVNQEPSAVVAVPAPEITPAPPVPQPAPEPRSAFRAYKPSSDDARRDAESRVPSGASDAGG
jgi:hypothetical protein